MKQNVVGIDLLDDMPGFVDDFDAAMQPDLAFAQKSLAKKDGFFPRRLGVRKFLALTVAAQGGAFTDMEIVTGHGLGFAVLSFR